MRRQGWFQDCPSCRLLRFRPCRENIAAVTDQSRRLTRPTLEQSQELLKKHPELKAGFRSPKNAFVEVNNWNYGNAVYYGNFVLGRIALRQDNVQLAGQYLL